MSYTKEQLIKEQNCRMCGGTGIVNSANGEDDFDVEYCGCSAGVRLAEQNETNQ